MADLATTLAQMEAQRDWYTLANEPMVQFGPPTRPFVGPTLLPERAVPSNEYSQEGIRYRTLIANDGSRYSAAQKRPSGMIAGTFLVSLGHQDVATEFTAADYDALLRYLRTGGDMTAIASLVNWGANGLVAPLTTRMEKQRWDALINASVVRTGDNGYSEIVNYPNPAGHRVAAGGAWSSNAYDPYVDIVNRIDLLYSKGYTANRFITSRKTLSILLKNQNIAQRAGAVRVLGNGTVIVGRANQADLNAVFAADGMPPIELHDNVYTDLQGTHRFMLDNIFFVAATTGVDWNVAYPSGEPMIIENTLGYEALGVAAGFDTPGRQIYVESMRDKPPRIEGQSWQASLPVVLEPEAIAIITGIA